MINRPSSEKIGYRKYLADLLSANNIMFDFVGSESSGNTYIDDADHAGFPGITASQLLNPIANGI